MLDKIFSCYVSRRYHGDRQAFERIQGYFAEATRYTEEKWDQVRDDEAEAIFTKGTQVAFTFDYRSSTLEVRSIISFDADNGTISVSVGNRGFPGEVHLAKARYQTLLDKIDAYIRANAIAASLDS